MPREEKIEICKRWDASFDGQFYLVVELFFGLAPNVVQEIFETIQRINKSGTTALLVEQNANTALHVADFGYVIENSLITAEGKDADRLEDEYIRAVYLGTTVKKCFFLRGGELPAVTIIFRIQQFIEIQTANHILWIIEDMISSLFIVFVNNGY